jgi:hypothetical protein
MCRRARPGFPPCTKEVRSSYMHATIGRYEGIDKARTEELTKKVGESFLPRVSKLDGFRGYYLIETSEGVMSSIGFFDTMAQADESTRLSATWVRDENLDTVLPNPPKVTGGEVIAKKIVERELVSA